MKNKRYLGAILLAPLVIFLFLGGEFLRYLLLVLSLMGMYEFFKVIKEKNIKPIASIAYIACTFYYILINKSVDYKLIALSLVMLAFVGLCIPVLTSKYNFIDVALTLFGYIYIPVFFSFIYIINLKSNGNYLIWLVFLSSWLCDTTAYYSGRFLGKHKLNSRVSPNKTIEGAVGGLMGSTVACIIFGNYLISKGVGISIYNFAAIGFLSGIFSQFGDLVASSIKRYINVKDYGNIIPGHGGILDRFDSILFSSVVVYIYITLIIGI
ncbi:phosphatidate cytidylyltransferase [Haloimpatiens sp. FM7315]|uniref:phosphatidate cytidylyltransferase n=1 Tax=Haloimpatiens sp. FM7315 TaxID=3298609 RepID=UPI0035A3A6D4